MVCAYFCKVTPPRPNRHPGPRALWLLQQWLELVVALTTSKTSESKRGCYVVDSARQFPTHDRAFSSVGMKPGPYNARSLKKPKFPLFRPAAARSCWAVQQRGQDILYIVTAERLMYYCQADVARPDMVDVTPAAPSRARPAPWEMLKLSVGPLRSQSP